MVQPMDVHLQKLRFDKTITVRSSSREKTGSTVTEQPNFSLGCKEDSMYDWLHGLAHHRYLKFSFEMVI